MATRLPGTLKFKPKAGRSKTTSGPSTPAISQSSVSSQPSTSTARPAAHGIGQDATPTSSSMPPPASVPRRASTSQHPTSATSPALGSQPLDSQATLIGSTPAFSNGNGLATIPDKRPGPEDAGPSTPSIRATPLSPTSTLVGGISQSSTTRGKVAASPSKTPQRARASSPALSAASISSARSSSSHRPSYSRPGGGKALLVAAAQSREDPLELPARVHRGGSRSRSRAASATPSMMSEAPPVPAVGAPMAGQSNGANGVSDVSPNTPMIGLSSDLVNTWQTRNTDGPPAFSTGAADHSINTGGLPALVTSLGPPSFAPAPPDLANAEVQQTEEAVPSTGSGEKRRGPGTGDGADQDGEDDSNGDETAAQAKKAPQPRKRLRRAKETWANRNRIRNEWVESERGGDGADAAGEADEDPQEIADGREASATPAPSTVASSRSRTKRPGKRKRSPRITIARANLDLVEPGEMIGDEVDEASSTMRELVTTRAGEGRVSARGKNLDRIIRERQLYTKDVGLDASDDRFRARQPLRRKMRAARNADRAIRRQNVQDIGGDPAEEVSADEADSEIDYEVHPERLTPESSPEPGYEYENQPDVARVHEREYDEDGNPIYYDDEFDEDGNLIVYEDDTAVDENGNTLHQEQIPDELDHVEADAAAAEQAGSGGNGEDAYDFSRYGLTFDASAESRRREGDDDDDDDIDIEHRDDDEAFNAYDAFAQLEERRQRRLDYNPDEVIEEDQEGVMINNASHAKRKPRERWTTEETEFFYAVLSETGENYGLMAHYFPRRTIDQVKRKALRENKVNPHRVTEAILNRKRLDPEYLGHTVGYSAEKSPERVVAFIAQVEDDFDRVKKSASEMANASGANGARHGTDGAIGDAAYDAEEPMGDIPEGEEYEDYDEQEAFEGDVEGDEGEAVPA